MYTLSQAATETGKQRGTILHAIKSGKLKAEKNERGQWQIDPDALHALYGRATDQDRITLLEAKLDALEQTIEQQKARIKELAIDRDYWREQAQALIVIAGKLKEQEQELGQPQGKPKEQPSAPEPEPAPPQEPGRKIFSRWLGKE